MTFYHLHLQLGGSGPWGDAAAFAFYRGLKTGRVPITLFLCLNPL
jgi:hypothetical protein